MIDYDHPDVLTLRKWLNEESTAPIDREALARVLGMICVERHHSEQHLDMVAQPEQGVATLSDFRAWMHKEMPADTVIGNSDWWAANLHGIGDKT